MRKTVLIVGATGYIGSAVVAEAVRQGHDVIAVTRSQPRESQFQGAKVIVADVAEPESLAKAFTTQIDIVISCLACRSGLPQDFDAIDYKATLNVLNAALDNGTQQFILLSAICVRKPDLPLQLAKLKMEDALMRSGIDYTIVRPTAYFWVFDNQTKNIEKGWPGFVIGTGEETVHNPIAKEDLAAFMIDSIANPERTNRIHIIGGPEVPENIVTYRDALQMTFEATGREPKIISIPKWLCLGIISITRVLGTFSRRIGVFSEFLHIVYYYLNNDMRAPGYGSQTLQQYLRERTTQSQTGQPALTANPLNSE